MTDRVPTLAQPPIVYGPSEISEWIQNAYPSERRGSPGPERRGRVRRLTVKVWSNSVPRVGARVIAALEALGYRAVEAGGTRPLAFRKADRIARTRFRPSLLGDSVTVAVEFAPPVPHTTPTRIAHFLAEEFPLGKVSIDVARLPTPSRHRGRGRAGASSSGGGPARK